MQSTDEAKKRHTYIIRRHSHALLCHTGDQVVCAGAFHAEEAAGPYTIAIEHAVNMLLARVAFDLLRSPKFKLQVIAHIQKKLDELKVPDYINALQVILVMPWRSAHTVVDAIHLLLACCSSMHVSAEAMSF